MPNKSAAIKFVRKSEARNLRNKSIKTEVRNLARKVEKEIEGKVKDAAMTALKVFESKGMSAVSKKVFHINTIARRISRLYARIQKVEGIKAESTNV
jgi:small subunit ribosomal protein S20